MRPHALAATAALVLTSCFSASRFEDQLFDAQCDWKMDCFPDAYASPDLCQRPEYDSDGCEFDAEKARDCVDAWEALVCDEPPEPAVCDAVWKCPPGHGDDDTGAGS